MSDTKYKKPSSFFTSIFLVASLLLAGLLLLNKQYVIDKVTVAQYSPSAEIATFAERTDMSEIGKFYFFASRPSLEPREGFGQKCSSKEENTAILGCYDGRNIYIQNISDTRLDGIREVTSAHEMLHAAYDRLSNDERQRIDVLLEEEYKKVKDDSVFAERMAFYARTEPGQRGNELHSVFGTEVASLSPELERHFGKYFVNRSVVVALHNSYARVFSDLQRRGEELSDELLTLGEQIKTDSSSYNTQVQELNREIEAFNQRAASGGFSSQLQFQTERNTFLERVSALDTERSRINQLVNRYEVARQELASVASESEALNKSIDSSLAPAPSL